MGAGGVSRRRLRGACALVGALLLVVALWNPVATVTGLGDAGAPQLSGARLAVGLMRGNAESELDCALGGGLREEDDVPAWFSQEVLALKGAREIQANKDWSVVGFQRDGSPEEALDWIAAEMLSHGWQVMESGVAGTVTGTKKEGRCRWMAISCTAVGDATCVVVQLPAAL